MNAYISETIRTRAVKLGNHVTYNYTQLEFNLEFGYAPFNRKKTSYNS